LIHREELTARFGSLFEHSPWVVQRASAYAPFTDAEALHTVLMEVVARASEEEQLALLRAHPDLATNTEPLTAESDSEQKGAGLKTLNAEELEKFRALNAEYREKFDFPFIICVRLHSKAEILAAFERRLNNTPEDEIERAIAEIGHITRLRLRDILENPKLQGLTTHVLDTVRGCGAAGMRVELRQPLKPPVAVTLDGQGRGTLLAELEAGRAELLFHAGAYFGGAQSFYDVIPVRFIIEADAGHIHVPLILSAFGYSTYRGG